MATDHKTVYRSFGYLRCDDFARYLEDMAAKGWHLESWGAGLKFRKGEPEQATYAVEVFTDASEYDTRPEPNTKEFAEYCEPTGWQLVDAKRKFVIFKKLRPDAHPIMTDEERLEAVVAEEKKKVYRNLSVSGTWEVFQWVDFFGTHFISTIFSTYGLMIQLGWTALFLAALGGYFHLMLWKHRSKKRIENGLVLYLGSGGSFPGFRNRGYNSVLVVVELLWLSCILLMGQYWMVLLVLGVFAGLWLMGYLIDKKRPDAVTNEIIQNVVALASIPLIFIVAFGATFWEREEQVHLDKVPLFYEDIGGEAGELGNVLVDGQSSPFGSALHCALDYEDEYFYYYVYKSEYTWVTDRVWQELAELEMYAESESYAELWEAEEALWAVNGNWAVRYPEAVLLFNGDDDAMLTPEQIEIIRSALID